MKPGIVKKKKIKCLLLSENVPGGELIAVGRLVKAVQKYSRYYQFIGLDYPKDYNTGKSRFIVTLFNDFLRIRNDLRKKTANQGFDFILSTHYLMTLAAKSLGLKNTKLIHIFHGTKAGLVKLGSDINYRKLIVIFLEKLSFNLSDRLIAPSIAASKYLSKTLFFKKQKKIFIVRNIVGTVFFKRYNADILKRKLGILQTGKIILYSGRIARYKGLENLALAFKKLMHDIPNLYFVIAYSIVVDFGVYGFLKSTLEIKETKNNVIFLNNSNLKEIVELYDLADVLVLPSELEFAPLTVIEAFAAGTPVVCTNAGNTKELVSKVDSNMLLKNNSPEEISKVLKRVLVYPDQKLKDIATKEIKIAQEYSEKKAFSDFQKALSFSN